MRDLEIRGAGNILGTKQSGHILAIGFDLYCQLLKQAVSKLKGEKVKAQAGTVLHLDFVAINEAAWTRTPSRSPAFLPTAYVGESQTRIQAYRKLAALGSQDQLDSLRKDWRDRFGPLPDSATNLLILSEIKIAAGSRKIEQVEVRENKLMLSRGGDYVLIGGKFPRLTAPTPDEQLREVLALIRSF